jgi:hypothetical protein
MINESTITSKKFFDLSSLIFSQLKPIIDVQNDYLIGKISSHELHLRIESISPIDINLITVYINKNPNIKIAINTLNTSNLCLRDSAPSHKYHSNLSDKELKFLFCATALFIQAFFGYHNGYDKYLIKSKLELNNVPAMLKPINNLTLLKNISPELIPVVENQISDNPELKTSIEIIDLLEIKNRSNTAQIKIACNIFVFFFGNYFKITGKNKRFLFTIIRDLIYACYTDTLPNENQIRLYTKKVITRAIKF